MENTLVKYTNEKGIAQLKDPVLVQAAVDLAAYGTALSKSLSDIARALGRVKVTIDRAGKDGVDGFTSVRDYAEELFGINRSQAYALATTGEKFYIPVEKAPKSIGEYRKQNPDVKADEATVKALYEREQLYNDFITAAPVSNLTELVNVDKDRIIAGLQSGEIVASSTQKQLREFRSGLITVGDGTKVLPRYITRVYIGIGTVIDFEDPMDEPAIKDELQKRFNAVPATKTLDTVERDGAKIKRVAYFTDNGIAMVELKPVPKAPKKSAKTPPSANPFFGLTREQAEALLAQTFSGDNSK